MVPAIWVAQFVIGLLLWERPLPMWLRWVGSVVVAVGPALLFIVPSLRDPANDWAGLSLMLGEIILVSGVIIGAIAALVGILIRRRRGRGWARK